MSIPVEFKPQFSSSVANPKVTIEMIDSVAPQSVPVTAPFNTFYPNYSKYEYKLQMSSDGNPIPSYGSQSLDGSPSLSIWNPDGQVAIY
jgi:hypothetical protein